MTDLLHADVEPSGVPPRRRHTSRNAAIVIGVVLVAFVAVLATRPTAADKQARSPLLGRQAPALSGTGITDGSHFDLSMVRGKYTLVNFFASWCVPCQREQPQLVRFAHEPAGDTALVSVLFSDTPSAAREYLNANGGDWPAIDDAKGQVALDYGVRGPPESYLLNRDGVVLAKFIGEVTADGLDRLVAQIKAAGQ